MADNIQIISFTQILRNRMAAAGRVDVNIMQLSEVDRPSKYEEHLGRFIGWFESSEEKPSLVILARSEIGGAISHLIALYPNTCYEMVPLSLENCIKNKLDKVPRVSVINVVSSLPGFCDLSILLEAAQFVLSDDIFRAKPPLYLELSNLGSMVASKELKDLATTCDHDISEDRAIITHQMVANKFMFVNIDDTQDIPISFDAMRIGFGLHYIYGINYAHEDSLLLLMPHIEQLKQEEHLVFIEEKLERLFPNRFKHYYSVRPRFLTKCSSLMVIKICILLTRLPLLYIEECDVITAFEQLNIWSVPSTVSSSQQTGSQRLDSQRSRLSQASQRSAKVSQDISSKPSLTLSLINKNRQPEVLSVRNYSSSPRTIASQESVVIDINAYTAWMATDDDVALAHPAIGIAQAMHLPTGSPLLKASWFVKQVERVKRYWDPFGKTKMAQPIDLVKTSPTQSFRIDDKDARFVLLPICNLPGHSDYGVLIFDMKYPSWGWIHPDNSAANSKEIVKAVQQSVMSKFPMNSTWPGEAIIISATYHKEYHYAHLIMALFYTAKLFCYAVKLPSKVIYNERELRQFAHKSCLAVQIANQKHNLAKKLIGNDGRLLAGAYYSLPSPIQYERSVVPSDLCGFCKRRGFANLGRHISMQHGGQAVAANLARLIKFGQSSKD